MAYQWIPFQIPVDKERHYDKQPCKERHSQSEIVGHGCNEKGKKDCAETYMISSLLFRLSCSVMKALRTSALKTLVVKHYRCSVSPVPFHFW